MTAEEIMAMFEKAKQMTPEELSAFAAQQAQTNATKPAGVTPSAGDYFSRYVKKECETEGGGIEWIGDVFSPNRVNVGVIIKNVAGHLTNLKAWLASIAPERLKSMRLLFIDDESDAATPNSNVASEPEIASEADVRGAGRSGSGPYRAGVVGSAR